MARNPKVEASAVNIRIPEDRERDYGGLMSALVGLRQGFRVYGDTYVAINVYDKKRRYGIVSKYTEIDIDGDWFDLEDFDVAAPERLEEVNIPERLRPNLSQFYFYLDVDHHVFVFESYSASKSLSARSMEKYFEKALRTPDIVGKYGYVEADLIQSFDEVDRLLDLPDLRELRLAIRRPNSDDIPGDLARVIEERLKEQNGQEYEERTSTKSKSGLVPNQRTRTLAYIAAENGSVDAKSLVNGIMTTSTTENSPLVVKDTMSPDADELPFFARLVREILEKIRSTRESYSDG